MDGRWLTVLLGILVPASLIGVTVVYFATNPLAILTLFGAIVAGVLYLVSYTDSF